MEAFDFKLDFQVRDYECDMQGVVNNAVYQNYLEHTRHEYLKKLGLDFAELTEQKVYLVLVKAELEYKKSLRSRDKFWVGLRVEKVSRVRFVFHQRIYREADGELILDARMTGTAVNEKGRPKLPDVIANALVSGSCTG